MAAQNQPRLDHVDWSKIPAPQDEGDTRYLTGAALPDVALAATDGQTVSLARLRGRSVVFVYPRTGLACNGSRTRWARSSCPVTWVRGLTYAIS